MSNQIFPDYVRSALFVDFDNIYITLSEEDEDIAKEFATNPSKWITWLEKKIANTIPKSTNNFPSYSGKKMLLESTSILQF